MCLFFARAAWFRSTLGCTGHRPRNDHTLASPRHVARTHGNCGAIRCQVLSCPSPPIMLGSSRPMCSQLRGICEATQRPANLGCLSPLCCCAQFAASMLKPWPSFSPHSRAWPSEPTFFSTAMPVHPLQAAGSCSTRKNLAVQASPLSQGP